MAAPILTTARLNELAASGVMTLMDGEFKILVAMARDTASVAKAEKKADSLASAMEKTAVAFNASEHDLVASDAYIKSLQGRFERRTAMAGRSQRQLADFREQVRRCIEREPLSDEFQSDSTLLCLQEALDHE